MQRYPYQYQNIIFLLLILFPSVLAAQGLRFYGNEKAFAERSTFHLYKETQKRCTKSFEIAFDFSIVNPDSPGSIMCVHDYGSDRTYSFSYVRDEDNARFLLSEVGKHVLFETSMPLEHAMRPIHVKICFYPFDDYVSVVVGNKHSRMVNAGIDKAVFRPSICFGMTKHIREIASFELKNLVVVHDGIRQAFPLNESAGNEIHDSAGYIESEIENPVWMINDSYHWKPLFSLESSTPGGMVFSQKRQEIDIFGSDSLITYSLMEGTTRSRPMAGVFPGIGLKLGMALPDISLHGDSILLYELYGIESYAALIDSGGNVRLFDRYERKGLVRHHHSAIHLPSAGKVIFFGGYGNRKYFNTFTCFDYRRREWTDLEFSGDTISPRFFAASAVSPDEKTVYIYGGKGNAIGSQDIGTTYYHDLYKLNLDSMTIRRLWTAQEPESEFVPTRNMVLSGNILYALVYPEFNPSSQLQLIELDIADGSMHAVGDTIPIISEEIATNAYLAYNSNRSQLLCMVQEFEKDGSRHLRAYSLAFPPVDASALVMPANSRKSSVMTILLCVVALAFLLGGIFLFKRHSRIRQDGHACDISDPVVAAPDNHVPVPTSVPENDVPVYEDEDVPSAATEKKCNSIMLFGPFTVFDRNGREITHLFRPKIKSLFAYLLINSVGGDGVLSATISSLFWPDKDPDKVKNLRNVSVSSIRNALQNISGIELVYIGGYFRLELTDECFCDYMAMSKATGNFTYSPSDDNLDNIIKICSRGKALTSFDSPIFDEVKGDVENFLMPLLCEAAEKSFRAGHNSQTLRICNSIFSLDPLSEQGLKYAVGVWSRRKDVPQAKRVYRNFIAEYRSSFGDEYPQTFDMIVKTTSAMQ